LLYSYCQLGPLFRVAAASTQFLPSLKYRPFCIVYTRSQTIRVKLTRGFFNFAFPATSSNASGWHKRRLTSAFLCVHRHPEYSRAIMYDTIRESCAIPHSHEIFIRRVSLR